MALKIGITGGIGSGKTTVSKAFEVLGIPVYYADLEAKRLMNEDETSVRLFSSSNQVLVSFSIAFFDSVFGANDMVLPANCPITLKLRQAKVIMMLNLKANCLIII